MTTQLSLFDTQKYSKPSEGGKPDWFYDTQDGFENVPFVNPQEDENGVTRSDLARVDRAQSTQTRITGESSKVNLSDIATGGETSPGEKEPKPLPDGCHTLSYTQDLSQSATPPAALSPGDESEQLDPAGEDTNSPEFPRGENDLDRSPSAMQQNIEGDRSSTVATDSTPLTLEQGRAFWDNLIFGRKTEGPGRVALETTGPPGLDNPGGSHLKGVQDSHHTPDMAFVVGRVNAIYRDEKTLSDQRQHNGKPGASGWIAMQFKYRDSEGKSKTTSKWIPGCTGPYYQYQWREGGRVRSRYLPRKKLEQVEFAIATRVSTWSILEILD